MNSESNSQAAPSTTSKPLARDIASALKSADSPLDFIRANLRTENPNSLVAEQLAGNPPINTAASTPVSRPTQDVLVAPATPQPISDATISGVAAAPSTPATPPPAQVQVVQEPAPQPVQEKPKAPEDVLLEGILNKEATNKEDPGKVEEEQLDADAPKDTTQENFKNLRQVVKATKEQLTAKERELEELQTTLKKYQTGEVLPDALQEKEKRIAQLEKFEKIVALKTSTEYKNRILEPLQAVQKQIQDIAIDYDIPVEVIERAAKFESRADLNRFLSDHFDAAGAIEVKQLIDQMKGLEAQANQLEEEPVKSLETLRIESERALASKRANQKAIIANHAKDSFSTALDKIIEEGKAKELIYRDGDSKHNQTYVEPLLKQSSSEYGKIVAMLADNGLEDLPKDLAYALARMTLLAHASSVAIETREQAIQRASEIEQNVVRTTKYVRPAVGSGGRGTDREPEAAPSSPRAAADALLSKVLGR